MSDLPKNFGPYVLLERLGTGGSGSAYLASPHDRSRLIVVKCLHPQLSKRKSAVQRFRHEASIAVLVDSPYLIRVLGAGEVDGVLYIAMERAPGWPLRDLLDALQQPMTIAAAVYVCSCLLSGLSALHEAFDPESGEPLGFVHRDVGPKNVVIGRDGQVHLIDLGIGRSSIQEWVTQTGAMIGTVGYMSPEQARGDRVDARTDLYAAGLLLFECLTGTRYIAKGERAVMLAAMGSPPRTPPSRLVPEAAVLDAFLAKALDPDPGRRFSTARNMRESLLAIVTPDRWALDRLVEEAFSEGEEEETSALLQFEETGTVDLTRTVVFAERAPSVTQRDIASPTVTSGPSMSPTRTGPTEPLATELLAARGRRARRRPWALMGVSGLVGAGFWLWGSPDKSEVVEPPPADDVVIGAVPGRKAPVTTTVTAERVTRRMPQPEGIDAGLPRPTRKTVGDAGLAISFEVRVSRLSEWAVKLRKSAVNPEALDGVIGDLALWKSAGDSEKAQKALDEIERQLASVQNEQGSK